MTFSSIQLTIGVVAVPISAVSFPCWRLLVQADPNNAGDTTIGDATVRAIRLAKASPYPTLEIPVCDASLIYARSSVNGDKLNVLFFAN